MCEKFDAICKEFAKTDKPLQEINDSLEAMGFGVFGVEYSAACGEEFYYINTGDTYSTTIIDYDGERIVSSWGDLVEDIESEYCGDTVTVQCMWCGHFTPVEDEWRNAVCENCGKNVVSG